MASTAQIPLVLLRNLAMFTGAPGADMTLVAVVGNKDSVRVSWDDLTSQFAVFSSVPSSASAAGSNNDIAIGDSFYTYYNGTWGKTVRYTNNWSDIDAATRFLLVNKEMTLSDAERANVQATIGLKIGSNSTAGLVKGSDSVNIGTDGTMTVPEATEAVAGITMKQGTGPAASTGYVDSKIAGIPSPKISPATETTLGGILASDTVLVSDTGQASVPVATPGGTGVGLVHVAAMDTYTDAQMGWVPPIALVLKIFSDEAANIVKPATSDTAGVILPTGALYLKDAVTGATDVRIANTTRYGIVKLVDTIPNVLPEGEGLVPSLKAVKDYIDAGSGGIIEPSNLPFATSSQRGAIISSATVRVNESGANVGQAYVPTATSNSLGVVMVLTLSGDTAPSTVPSASYMNNAITNATSGIQAAAVNEAKAARPTATAYGMVRVTVASTDTTATMSTVPTTLYMQQYVTQAISSGTGWTGGVVNNLSTFNGGIRTVFVNSPTDNDVLNYGQLKTLFSA